MFNRRRLIAVVPLCALCCALCACNLELDTVGEQNQLSFSIVDPDSIFGAGFSTALAEGTRARISVKPADGSVPRDVIRAATDAPSVASVVETDGSEVVVEAHAAGDATLAVDVDGGSDLARLRVEPVGRTELVSLLDTELVLEGGTEPLGVRRFDAQSRWLAGEAQVGQVMVAPEGAAERVPGPDHRVLVRYKAPGSVVLSVDGGPLSREVVAVAQVARFAVSATLEEERKTTTEDAQYALVEAFAADERQIAGVTGAVQAVVADPTVCTVTWGDWLGNEGVRFNGHRPGTCEVTFTLGEHTQVVRLAITTPSAR